MRDSLKILALTLGLLLGIEVILQIFYFANLKWNNSKESALVYQPNNDYLIELIPNTEKLFVRTESNGGDSILWKVNSEGFRGSELQPDPDKRIMVYGDSNIQARFSVEDSTFVQKIGKYLRTEKKQNIELINSGVIGFGPDQSLLKFEEEVSIYKPDLVVFTVFAYNDYGDPIRNRIFELDDDSVIRTNFIPEVDAQIKKRKPVLKFQILSWTNRVRLKILKEIENPNSKEHKEGVLDYYLDANKEAFEIYKKGGKRKFSNFEDPFDIDVVVDPNSESSVLKKDLFKSLLQRFDETAKKNNVELVVVILPSPIEMTIANDYLGYEFISERFPFYDRKKFTNSIESLSVDMKLNTINLFPVFDSNTPENLYFKDADTHWNDAGQDLAAKVTASFVLDSLWNK